MKQAKFKIGIWIDKDINPQDGGAFNYTEKLIRLIKNHSFQNCLEIIFVGFNLENNQDNYLNLPYKESLIEKKKTNFYHKFFGLQIARKDIKRNYQQATEILKKNDIQLLFYSSPMVRIDNFPYIFVNWDLGHRSTFSFPELSLNGNYNKREIRMATILNEALFVCSESEAGKLEMIKYYKLNESKIKVLPMFAGDIIKASFKPIQPIFINSSERFFFYPAQFWPHKNHYNLIMGFKDFIKNENFMDYKLILPGSEKGNINYIQELIINQQLCDNVIIPGFITNEELKWMYLNTVGMVFPSMLGPTNMPLLEAKLLGCKVACSNLVGHKEMLKDSAIYFEPLSHLSICDSLLELTNENKTQKVLIEQPAEDCAKLLETIFIESIPLRKTWGNTYSTDN